MGTLKVKDWFTINRSI